MQHLTKCVLFSFLISVTLLACGHARATSDAPPTDGRSTLNAPSAPELLTPQSDSIEEYYLRYGLHNIFDKLVDNHGDGYDALYGVRNLRMVLTGIVYRGGANNAFNKHGKRANANPLPTEGLQHLCEEGFDQAVYLYPTRFSTAPVTTKCRTRTGEDLTLTYSQHSDLASPTEAREVLSMVYAKLINPNNRHPIYLHCWNGWHASGYISALSLRQFCGMSASSAVDYWNRNTDGDYKGVEQEHIRQMISAFPTGSIPRDLGLAARESLPAALILRFLETLRGSLSGLLSDFSEGSSTGL